MRQWKKDLAMFSIAIFRPDEVLSVEKKNGKSAHISWIMPNDLDRWKPLIYIIQQKSHIGMVNWPRGKLWAFFPFAFFPFVELKHFICLSGCLSIHLSVRLTCFLLVCLFFLLFFSFNDFSHHCFFPLIAIHSISPFSRIVLSHEQRRCLCFISPLRQLACPPVFFFFQFFFKNDWLIFFLIKPPQQHNEHLMKTWEHVALVVNERNLQYKVIELGYK